MKIAEFDWRSRVDNNKLNTLAQFITMGWSLIPLHDVSAGYCSCQAGTECRSAGKHPRNKSWQSGGWVRDVGTLTSVTGDRPGWNWGAVTGAPSRMWALDVDPEHGGMDSLWELLCAAKVAPAEGNAIMALGALTRTHWTGSRGLHAIFAIGADGWMPPTSVGREQRLGRGLDVRAAGGQIVLPGSVSDKGPYEVALERASEVCPPELRAEIERRLAPPSAVVPPVRPAGVDDQHEVSARGEAYAARVLQEECAELRDAPVGTRNDTAYAVACRLHELVNAGWCSLDETAAWEPWFAAGTVTGAPYSELAGVWARARDRVAGTAAELPVSTLEAERVPFAVPVQAPPSVVSTGSVPAGLPLRQAGDPGGVPAGVVGGVPADPVDELIARMRTPEQLDDEPAPRPLVNGLLDLDTCAWLIGPPGSCKSFVALDVAAHVGRGLAWQGRAVHQGLVVYIAAEGARGMRLRSAAWRREYGHMKDLLFLPEPVQADERAGAGGWTILVEALRRLEPVLVVIDTQARVTVGLEENSAKEMGTYVHQADRIRRATGACVLTVHHSGRGSTNARGSSALDAAQDAELRIERPATYELRLISDKQKDQEQAEPIELRLTRSEGGADPETGRDLSSLVLVAPPMGGLRQAEMPAVDVGTARARLLYALMVDLFNPGEGGSRTAIRGQFLDLPEIRSLSGKAADKAWLRAWARLVKIGIIAKRNNAALFKVVVIQDQTIDGVLTVNEGARATLPPAGFDIWWPDNDSAMKAGDGE